MSTIHEICSVCAKKFDVVFRYQMEERDGGFAFYCSQACVQRSHGAAAEGSGPMVTCDGCAKRFSLTLASQVLYASGRRRYACGMPCRRQLLQEATGARLEQFAHPVEDAEDDDDSLDAVASSAGESGPEPERAAGGAPAPAVRETRAVAVPVVPEVPVLPVTPASLAAPVAPRAPTPEGGRRSTSPQSAKPGVVGRGALRAAVSGSRHDRGRLAELQNPMWPPRRIAVFNHKGGTGKTTTSVSLAAGLAERGKRVLLMDTDSQGNVAVSLGVNSDRSLYHVLVMGLRVQDVVRTIRPNLDVLPSNETLAAAELYLAGRQQRDRVLAQRMESAVDAYDYVIIDCSPSLSLMNQNALVLADSVLVPVACDYLSLVGVRQVIKTVRNVNALLHHKLQIWGVLPTFFDVRAKICNEALETLRNHFGDRCMAPIRATTRLKEAPARAQSIFEYAPATRGAEDYLSVVGRMLGGQADATWEPPAVVPTSAPQTLAAQARG